MEVNAEGSVIQRGQAKSTFSLSRFRLRANCFCPRCYLDVRLRATHAARAARPLTVSAGVVK
jgi:hypothetical protein